MSNPVKKFIDSVLFAGLKPNVPGQAPPAPAEQGAGRRLWERVNRWAAGAAPDDPLYLSNRTWQQKLRMSVTLGIPCLILVGGLVFALGSVLIPGVGSAPKAPTLADVVSKVLPDVDKTAQVEKYKDAEIGEIFPDTTAVPPKLRGKIQNNTGHKLSVEFTADLTDADGARVGAVSERVLNIPAHDSVLFDFPLKPTAASIALVREIRTIE